MGYPTDMQLLGQTLGIEARDIVVTEAEQGEDGYYYREFRFFGEPATEGGTLPLVLVVRAKSLTKTDIDVTAPAQEF